MKDLIPPLITLAIIGYAIYWTYKGICYLFNATSGFLISNQQILTEITFALLVIFITNLIVRKLWISR